MRFTTLFVLCLLALAAATTAHAEGEIALPASAFGPQLELQAPIPVPYLPGSYVLPAWRNNDITGSIGRYEKYVAPPQGGFIDGLQLASPIAVDHPYLQLRLSGVGQPASKDYFLWQDPYRLGRVEAFASRYRFDLYPEASGSLRQEDALRAATLLADGVTSVGFTTNHQYVRIPKPGGLVDFSVNRYAVTASRPVGLGDVDLAMALREYQNRDGLLPNTRTATYELRYSANLPLDASAGAHYSFSQISQGGRVPRIQAWGVAAMSPAGSDLVASASYDARRVQGALEQTAYTKAVRSSRLALRYRGVPGLSLRVGYDQRGIQRENFAHTGTDSPEWNNLWAAASYRPIRRIQIIARAADKVSPNPPNSDLSDPLPLVMNLDRSAEVRVQGMVTENATVYASANSRFRKNTRRNIELQSDDTAIGGWLQVGPRLSLNVDYSLQWFDSRTLLLAIDPTTGQSLLSDGQVTTASANYALRRNLSFDGSYSHYRATRAQDINQDVWGIAARRYLPAGNTLSLEFRRDIYRDRIAAAQSYTANVISASGTGRF